jgi:hypothetical protein
MKGRTVKHFALLPKIVRTWRRRGRAIIWMQEYFVKGDDKYVSLNDDSESGYKYCLKLGIFSYEL